MIIFSSVTKKFGSEKPALEDVSFTIDEGEMAVITGPSGSGKTSLMRLLTKEYQPDEGEIKFDGTSLDLIRRGNIHHHRRKIGVVFQDYKLLHELNVWENIALALSIIGSPNHEIEERVTDLLKLVDLVDKAFLFPSQLSGGEAQRVSIARALSTAPKVIFADEPTGNLDTETSANIITLLKKINQLGTTVMVTTHDPVVTDILSDARLLHLNKGTLEKDTKPNSDSKSRSSSKKSTPRKREDDDQEDPVVKIEVSSLSDNDTDERASDSKEKTKETKKDTTSEKKDEHANSSENKKSNQKSKHTLDKETSTTSTRVRLNLPGFMTAPFSQKKTSQEKKTKEKNSDSNKADTTKKKDSDHE